MSEIIEMAEPSRQNVVATSDVNRFTAIEIRERVNLVQEIMRNIMKPNTHFGIIPGTQKPTLYKPGAEVLCVTFRIAPEYDITDLSDSLTARFRVKCVGVHQVTNQKLGEGVGECSSGEEKFKWRAAICSEEFDLTPENMRRLKFAKYKGNVEKKIQIRTEAADMSNTVLKMACKRALLAMTLNVTAASDIFSQDLDEIPEELRQHVSEPAPKAVVKQAVAGADFTNALQSIREGKYDAESMRGFYALTPDQETALSDLEKELQK